MSALITKGSPGYSATQKWKKQPKYKWLSVTGNLNPIRNNANDRQFKHNGISHCSFFKTVCLAPQNVFLK